MSLVYDVLTNRHPELLNNALLLSCEPKLLTPAVFKQHGTTLATWHWPLHQHAQRQGLNSQYGLPQSTQIDGFDTAILVWPKSKKLGVLLVQLLATHYAHCFVVGANNLGGKTLNKACRELTQSATKVDSAKHCSLWKLTLKPQASFNWLAHSGAFAASGRDYLTLPGVFSHASLDVGTRVLLSIMPAPSKGRLLDVGCGSGVIGLSFKHTSPKLDVGLLDIDAFALKSAELNALRQGLSVEVKPSDVLEAVQDAPKSVDFIVTNPPFHDSKDTNYHFAEHLFEQAAKVLVDDGQLWLVANRHLPYETWAATRFESVHIATQEQGFKVIVAQGVKR